MPPRSDGALHNKSGRPLAPPGARLFKLIGKSQQRGFSTHASGELGTDRQASNVRALSLETRYVMLEPLQPQ
jgi:hypothetical protein